MIYVKSYNLLRLFFFWTTLQGFHTMTAEFIITANFLSMYIVNIKKGQEPWQMEYMHIYKTNGSQKSLIYIKYSRFQVNVQGGY